MVCLLLECRGKPTKTVSPSGPARHFWLNSTFVKYQSSKIKAFSCCVFITDIQIHLWLLYLWCCCFITNKRWRKISSGDLSRNQNVVFSFKAFHSGSCHHCVESRAYSRKMASHSCTRGNPHRGPTAEEALCFFAAFLLGWFPQAWERCNLRHCSSH